MAELTKLRKRLVEKNAELTKDRALRKETQKEKQKIIRDLMDTVDGHHIAMSQQQDKHERAQNKLIAMGPKTKTSWRKPRKDQKSENPDKAPEITWDVKLLRTMGQLLGKPGPRQDKN